MEKIDARTLNQDAQYQIRRQVVKLRKRGMKYKDIGEILGITKTYACTIFKRYERDGSGAIAKRRRGRRPGEQLTLQEEQAVAIQKMIIDKTPDQLKMPFALWTRQAVQQLIKQMCEIVMPIRTVGEYLKRWGFTPQRPVKRAYEQNPKAVNKWLEEEYPSIAQKVKQEGGEIHWCDETGVRNDESSGRGYAPKGKTPIMRLNANRKSISMISAITNQGKVRFMVYKDAMDPDLFIKFMGRLIKDAGRKVFLIVDNLRTHHSKPVKEWLQTHREKIEVFYLPSYSPELNPDEYLNCDMKTAVHSGIPARNEEGLKRKVVSHMRKLQKLPERIKKYFKHPRIKYAA
ncbi:MAG: IS630 family transposase [Nitrospirota bacterium]